MLGPRGRGGRRGTERQSSGSALVLRARSRRVEALAARLSLQLFISSLARCCPSSSPARSLSRVSLVARLSSSQCRYALSLLHLSHANASLTHILFNTASQLSSNPSAPARPSPHCPSTLPSLSPPDPLALERPHLDHLRRPRPVPFPLPLPRPARRLLGAPRAELAPVQDALVGHVGDDLRGRGRGRGSALACSGGARKGKGTHGEKEPEERRGEGEANGADGEGAAGEWGGEERACGEGGGRG